MAESSYRSQMASTRINLRLLGEAAERTRQFSDEVRKAREARNTLTLSLTRNEIEQGACRFGLASSAGARLPPPSLSRPPSPASARPGFPAGRDRPPTLDPVSVIRPYPVGRAGDIPEATVIA